MIVDTMSYSEIREYLFNNMPDEGKVMNFFYKNLRRSVLKAPNKYIFNTMYSPTINGVTYYVIYEKLSKKDFGAALFAKFFYKGHIRIVSLSKHNKTIQWYSAHYRERVVERSSNNDYSLKTFFKTMIPLMKDVTDIHNIYQGNTGYIQNGYFHVVDTSNLYVVIYKTIIPLNRENYINKQLIKSHLGELSFKS